MSRGRKPNQKAASIDWSYIFKKNAGSYFNTILSHIGCYREIGDGHGLEVLNEISKEKEKRKLKEKPFQKLTNDEIPFEIPQNWVWCRLGEMSINRDGERNPISLTDRNTREKTYDYYGASGVIDKIDGYTHEGELLLIGEDGANLVSRSTPIAFIATGKYWVNNHAHVIETVHRITLDYLKCYINSIDLKPYVTGGFQPKLSQGNLNIIPVPLPPISFQEKIIEFFTDFENNNIKANSFYFKSQIEKKIVEIHKSQLSAAKIITENNFQLTQLENLNQAILQEAAQGKLVKQNPKDEPASELLKRIKAEKAKSGKKEKPLPPIKPGDIPFEIPKNWEWCRLGEISNIVRGGSPRPAGDKTYYDGNIPFLKVGDLTDGNDVYLYKHTFTIKEAGLNKTRFVEANTLMLTNSGATLGYPKICTFPTTFNDGIAAFLDLSDDFDKIYLFYFLKSLTNWFLKEASRGQGQPNLNTDIIGLTPFPIPPKQEQKRIVAEIEKQLAKTKQLKEHIIANQKATEQLLKALLHQAFEVEEMEEI